MAYTNDQINSFIKDKGIADNPYAMFNYAKQYGIDPAQFDQARGNAPGTAQAWMDQNKLGGPQGDPTQYSAAGLQGFANNRGLSAADPHKAYAYANQYGVDPSALAGQIGSNATDANNWMQQAGLGGSPAAAPAAPPTMPGAGGPPPSQPQNPYMPNPTANPYQPMAGGAAPGQQNPYTAQMGADITRQVTNNLQRNILPGIGRGAVAAGGYGGSRQGIAEGLAIGETNQGLAGQLANLYGTQFNTDRNYGLQNDALDLNVYNSNQNWMNQGQQNQLNTIDKLMGWNQQGINNATTVQNTPLNYYSQFANIGQGLGGMGSTNTQNMQGNPWLGALGGYQLGSKIAGG